MLGAGVLCNLKSVIGRKSENGINSFSNVFAKKLHCIKKSWSRTSYFFQTDLTKTSSFSFASFAAKLRLRLDDGCNFLIASSAFPEATQVREIGENDMLRAFFLVQGIDISDRDDFHTLDTLLELELPSRSAFSPDATFLVPR